MQSWCPEEFDLESEHSPAPEAGETVGFTQEAVATSTGSSTGGTARFRRETGFTDPATIMSHMSQQERAVVFELVELDVAAAYEEREQKLRDELKAQQETESKGLRESTLAWSTEFAAQRDMEMQEMAAACARLALELAEKIVRSHVAGDPGVIARAVETALRAGDMNREMTVHAAPEDAARLEADDELRKRLGISRVVADRRISRGGCLVSSGDREWNATLEGQLATLGEVIEEWIVTAGHDEDMGDEPGKDPVESPVE